VLIALAEHSTSLSVRTVADMGWSGIKSGQLLTLAESEFDVFVTVDRNLSFQQHLPKFQSLKSLKILPASVAKGCGMRILFTTYAENKSRNSR
jgi:hypothetical protein